MTEDRYDSVDRVAVSWFGATGDNVSLVQPLDALGMRMERASPGERTGGSGCEDLRSSPRLEFFAWKRSNGVVITAWDAVEEQRPDEGSIFKHVRPGWYRVRVRYGPRPAGEKQPFVCECWTGPFFLARDSRLVVPPE